MKRFFAILLAMLLAAVLICIVSEEILVLGERGERVCDMQMLLTDIGYNSVYPGRDIASYWDPKRSTFTEVERQSLREFQADWDLPQTGIYGLVTRRTLERVHASRFDEQTEVFYRNCIWSVNEKTDQLEFRCVMKQWPSFGGLDSLTAYCYCEEDDGSRIAPEQGKYFSQTVEKFMTNDTCITDWFVFDDAEKIDKVFVAVHSLNGEGVSLVIPDEKLHFVEYRIR